MFLRLTTTASLAFLAFALVPGRAHPATAATLHLRLIKSEPSKGDTVTSPAAIRLWFSQEPAMTVTTVKLKGWDAREIVLAKPVFSGDVSKPVEAVVTKPLAPGRYTVTWKTASKDMHPVTGEFSFLVR